MKKLLVILAMLALRADAQVGNPQSSFSSAVQFGNPSLHLNFNDSTTSFKDSVSQVTFGHSAQGPYVANHCIYGAATSASLTCTVTSTASDALIVFAAFGSTTVSSVTDSLGATATLIGGPTSSAVAYYFPNVSAGSHVITMTLASSISNSYPQMQVVDVVGAATSSPIDTTAFNTVATAGTSIYSSSVTTTVPGDLLLGQFALGGSGGGWVTKTTPPFLLFTGTYTNDVVGSSLIGAAGSYTFSATSSVSLPWNGSLLAIKPKANAYTSPGTTSVHQPGFDSTNNANYSAEFTYNAWNAAPNNTLGTMDWSSPWTMLIHIDRLNWDRTGTLVLASKGDTGSSFNSYWELVVQPPSTDSVGSQFCFIRNGYGEAQANQSVCTNNEDAMPNGLNYDIVIEDAGTGAASALSMYVNGSAVLQTYSGSLGGGYGNGFGNVALSLSGTGSGYANTTYFTSTGGGTHCTVTGQMNSVSGVPASVVVYSGSDQVNYGCTSNPTIVLTSPTGTGTTVVATAQAMSMNSASYPLMVPGYVSNGTYYGPGGTDTSQNPLFVDEFASFSGDLSFGQVTNIFYTTKFYQNLLYPSLAANPPLVILGGYGCGPDFSGDQTLAMTLGAARAGIIKLIGVTDDDGNANGSNSVGWWRQMLDQAGLNDVPVSVGPGSPGANTGGCPAANITAYNASTAQNTSSYESSVTMYRTLFAKYSTTPIYALVTQTANGYASFLTSPADGISSLTGLQLQAQNAANGGYINLYQGNISLTPTYYTTIYNNNGTMPIYIIGGAPAIGGPGILVSRTANDPLWLVASEMVGGDAVAGYTQLNLAQVLSPYFLGGVTVSYSGGTGYANSTPFTSTGGGTYCHVTGIMTASGGVPNGIETSWGASFPPTLTYNGLGYGCTSAPTIVLTAPTGTGVTLTASNPLIPTCYGTAGCVDQYVLWPNTYSVQSSGTTTAPVFAWFENSLMDPPTNGVPRTY